MKTELLAAYAALGDLIYALPNDPVAQAPTPTGLAVVYSSVMGTGVAGITPDNRVLSLGIGWDDTTPNPVRIYVKGAEGNPAGPQEWTEQPYVNNGPDGNGSRFTYVMQNPAGQSVLFRLVAMNSENSPSEPLEITVNADDYLTS